MDCARCGCKGRAGDEITVAWRDCKVYVHASLHTGPIVVVHLDSVVTVDISSAKLDSVDNDVSRDSDMTEMWMRRMGET